MLARFQLDERSEVPLYRQLHEQIASLIRRGLLSNGERLPPTRELASQFGLNRTTVSAAYALLESDGLIQGHVGRGSFVQYQLPVPAPNAAPTISFASSRPDPEAFPLREFQDCCREVIGSPEAGNLLQLGAPAGYAPLRDHLLQGAVQEGIARSSDDVVVTNGCQGALDLLARVLAPAGAVVAIEDPVYHGLRAVFERSGAQVLGIPIGRDGIDLREFARMLAIARPRLLVVTPEFQNPTGVTMPLEARRELLKMARAYEVIVVENSLYRGLRYTGKSVPTLKELDETGEVILLHSYSKIAFPGLRVGWILAPARVGAEIAEVRRWCDLHTDHLSQAFLLRYSESGRLAEHVARTLEAGRERLQAILRACRDHLPKGSEYTRPQGGMNLWVQLPEALDTTSLLPAAERAGVTYLPGPNFAVAAPQRSALRLSFGALSPERIETGVALLGTLFKNELSEKNASARPDTAPALV